MLHYFTASLTRKTFDLFVVAALLAGLALGLGPAPLAQAGQNGENNGEFTVSVFRDGTWRTIGSLSYGKHPAEKQLDLSGLRLSGEVKVRLDHSGDTAAHIDAVLLGGQAPRNVVGAGEKAPLALKKLARRDHDLIDAQGRTLTFTFDIEGKAPTLSLTARIEPETIGKIPFQFPRENRYQKLDTSSSFYTYTLNSQRGNLGIDGNLENENLGTPFFKAFIRPGSGHPSDFTYGWVRNDDQNLYVVIDFVSDNTMDGDKDYATVYVNTRAGLKEFKVSVPKQRWGVPGFVYTDRAVYQHKVYEFQIPFSEIGLAKPRTGETVELAFAAYGTATETNFSKSFTDDPVVPGGTVTLEFTIANNHAQATLTDITFTDDFDNALSGLVAVGLPANDVCGVGSQLSGTSLLTLTGGNLAPQGSPGDSCTFSVTLQVPAGAVAGTYLNETSLITGTRVVGESSFSFEDDGASDNLEVAYGTIIIKKVTEPAGGTGFQFTNDIPGGPTPFTLNDGQQRQFEPVPLGTHTVTEIDPMTTPGSYVLTDVTCEEEGGGEGRRSSTSALLDPVELPSSGDVGTRTATIGLDNGETVTCTFTNALQFNLTVTEVEACSGRVTSSPSGINCGDDCSEYYFPDTVVTLTAYPGVNSYFIEWGGDCAGTDRTIQVPMDADKTCTATFGCPVGGVVVPVEKLGLVAPWLGLVGLAGLAALGVVVVRRRKG